MEAAMKLARQYFLQISPKSPRVNFIAREGSWHGCTLGALSLGDFKSRKVVYEELLNKNVTRVSACHPYRGLLKGENEAQYVVRLQAELDDEFKRVGPETVCAFVVEPMVGTVSPATVVVFRTMADENRPWAAFLLSVDIFAQ